MVYIDHVGLQVPTLMTGGGEEVVPGLADASCDLRDPRGGWERRFSMRCLGKRRMSG